MRRCMQKRMVSLVLTVALLLTSQSMVQMVYADETGTQERVIYISTPEQLMAISEEDTNCYYELENDIDLAGYDWVPVSMGADSTFNGAGYTIRNMTVTKAGKRMWAETEYAGLFTHIDRCYVTDLNLENMKMELVTNKATAVGSIAGSSVGGSINNCSVSGSIEVEESSVYGETYVCGLENASKCESQLDIQVVGFRPYVCGITDSRDCDVYGDIDVKIQSDEVNEDADTDVAAVNSSSNCFYKGDVTVSGGGDSIEAQGIWGGIDCTMEGDILILGEEVVSYVNAYGVSGRNSVLKGNVLASSTNATPYVCATGVWPGAFKASYECEMYGNVTSETKGNAIACGIEFWGVGREEAKEGSIYLQGDITAVGGKRAEVAGIRGDGGPGYHEGDIYVSGETSNAYGVYGECPCYRYRGYRNTGF